MRIKAVITSSRICPFEYLKNRESEHICKAKDTILFRLKQSQVLNSLCCFNQFLHWNKQQLEIDDG
jgi:hypothetical protein